MKFLRLEKEYFFKYLSVILMLTFLFIPFVLNLNNNTSEVGIFSMFFYFEPFDGICFLFKLIFWASLIAFISSHFISDRKKSFIVSECGACGSFVSTTALFLTYSTPFIKTNIESLIFYLIIAVINIVIILGYWYFYSKWIQVDTTSCNKLFESLKPRYNLITLVLGIASTLILIGTLFIPFDCYINEGVNNYSSIVNIFNGEGNLAYPIILIILIALFDGSLFIKYEHINKIRILLLFIYLFVFFANVSLHELTSYMYYGSYINYVLVTLILLKEIYLDRVNNYLF